MSATKLSRTPASSISCPTCDLSVLVRPNQYLIPGDDKASYELAHSYSRLLAIAILSGDRNRVLRLVDGIFEEAELQASATINPESDISELGLDTQIVTALRSDGIDSVWCLELCTVEYLLGLPRIRATRVKEIEAALAKHGRKLSKGAEDEPKNKMVQSKKARKATSSGAKKKR